MFEFVAIQSYHPTCWEDSPFYVPSYASCTLSSKFPSSPQSFKISDRQPSWLINLALAYLSSDLCTHMHGYYFTVISRISCWQKKVVYSKGYIDGRLIGLKAGAQVAVMALWSTVISQRAYLLMHS